jgi:DNA-binding CsgD family transcriptional regulator/PAS domain-containing protein
MSDLLPAAALSEIVGIIYDCALDPSGWPAVLATLRQQLRFHNASMSLQSLPHGQILLSFDQGIDEPWRSRMREYGHEVVVQWGGLERIQTYPSNEPQVLTWVNPDAASESNRYYTEWSRPQGLIDVMALQLSRDSASLGSLALGRHEQAGPITEQEVAAARLILPHLQRAIAITRLLEARTVTATTFEAVFDELTAAVILVDAEMRILHANTAADSLRSAGDLLQVRAGRLSMRSRAAQRALVAAVDEASRNGSRIGKHGVNVPASSDHGCLYVLHVLPINSAIFQAGVMPAAMAAIFVATRLVSRVPSTEAISALFALTAMESRVLERIAAGLTNAEIAETLGIAVSTVRTHLHHIFDKTGMRRQAELVALVASFELPVSR